MVTEGRPKHKRPTQKEVHYLFQGVNGLGKDGVSTEITLNTWMEWVKRMEFKSKTELLYYSQFLTLLEAPTDTPDQVESKAFAEGAFNLKLRGAAALLPPGVSRAHYVVNSIKYLVNEMMSVGEHFICQQIDNQCIENPMRIEG